MPTGAAIAATRTARRGHPLHPEKQRQREPSRITIRSPSMFELRMQVDDHGARLARGDPSSSSTAGMACTGPCSVPRASAAHPAKHERARGPLSRQKERKDRGEQQPERAEHRDAGEHDQPGVERRLPLACS